MSCQAQEGTNNVHYIFGYGSLIDTESRRRTTPDAGDPVPVVVRGVERGWWIPGNPVSFSTTFLAIRVVDDTDTVCNGVVYSLTDAELEETDAREGIYERVAIDYSDIDLLVDPDFDSTELASANVWAYVLPADSTVRQPDARYPIVQSYIDMCLTGCLDIEADFPAAAAADFSRMFIQTTKDWSSFWVNDRLYPRRAFIFVPKAFRIDSLLSEELEELYKGVQIQPASWE